MLLIFFSGQCYKRQMQPLRRTARTPFVRKPHSIRLVEVPGGHHRGIKLSAEPDGSCHGLTISEYVFGATFINLGKIQVFVEQRSV